MTVWIMTSLKFMLTRKSSEKKELDLYFSPWTKINFRWLNNRIKVPKNGIIFLKSRKCLSSENKTDKSDCIKLKHFCRAKTTAKSKAKNANWEKFFPTHVWKANFHKIERTQKSIRKRSTIQWNNEQKIQTQFIQKKI